LAWLSKLAVWVQQVLLPWGSWGLVLAAVLDSSIVPFPSGVDLWMITLCVQNPSRAPLYVLVASLGSVVGATALAFAVSKGEQAILSNKIPPDKLEHARKKIEKSGFWALVGGTLLPPPAPFKLFIVAAGLLQYPLGKFALAVLLGRLARYSLEAYLAVRYGHEAWQLLLHAGPWAFVAAGVVLAIVLVLWKLRRSRTFVSDGD
jgi:membrane protein YqaA with SNARE-associated domain